MKRPSFNVGNVLGAGPKQTVIKQMRMGKEARISNQCSSKWFYRNPTSWVIRISPYSIIQSGLHAQMKPMLWYLRLRVARMIMMAFITISSGLVPLIESLCTARLFAPWCRFFWPLYLVLVPIVFQDFLFFVSPAQEVVREQVQSPTQEVIQEQLRFFSFLPPVQIVK